MTIAMVCIITCSHTHSAAIVSVVPLCVCTCSLFSDHAPGVIMMAVFGTKFCGEEAEEEEEEVSGKQPAGQRKRDRERAIKCRICRTGFANKTGL